MNTPAATLTLSQRPTPPISNGRLGMMLLVGTETVLFTCFISAYLVLRMAALTWPPEGTPALQVGLSVFNTAALLASSFVAFAYGRAMSRDRIAQVRSQVAITLGLGILFILLQGVEFHHLYARGLTLKSGPYGAIFFTLVGCHGLHVLGGLGLLGAVLRQVIVAQTSAEIEKLREWVSYSEMYWYFVTAVWLILFSILYII